MAKSTSKTTTSKSVPTKSAKSSLLKAKGAKNVKPKVTATKTASSKSKPIKPEVLEADLNDDLDLADVADKPKRDGSQPVAAVQEETEGLDTLQKYLAEVRKHPLLTPGEEHDLAVRFHEAGDRKAAEKLVTANLRFVVKVAAEYSKFGARMIDLIQEGNVGLMHAVREFNPYKGVRLITYAVWWIRGYIQEYLIKNYSQVKIGTTQAQKKLFYHLNKEKAKLDAFGNAPDVKLLSSRLGVTEDEVIEMSNRLSGRDLSLDAPQGDEDGARRFVESQADTSSAPIDEALALEEEKEIFHREIEKVKEKLNDKEKYLLQHRVLSDPPQTLQEVGDHFKITRERARQLEERLIEKIKIHFQSAFPDYKIKLPEK